MNPRLIARKRSKAKTPRSNMTRSHALRKLRWLKTLRNIVKRLATHRPLYHPSNISGLPPNVIDLIKSIDTWKQELHELLGSVYDELQELFEAVAAHRQKLFDDVVKVCNVLAGRFSCIKNPLEFLVYHLSLVKPEWVDTRLLEWRKKFTINPYQPIEKTKAVPRAMTIDECNDDELDPYEYIMAWYNVHVLSFQFMEIQHAFINVFDDSCLHLLRCLMREYVMVGYRDIVPFETFEENVRVFCKSLGKTLLNSYDFPCQCRKTTRCHNAHLFNASDLTHPCPVFTGFKKKKLLSLCTL